MTLLEVIGLSFGYHGRPVGHDVHLQVGPGEVVALLGPNGSGKTTLFKTILGTLPPLAGEVRYAGEPAARWPRRRLARLVAYVPQAHNALFPFSVLDVVLMGRTARLPLFAVPSRQDRHAALEALTALGIEHLAPRVYTEVSGGERQLVLIARALAQQPRLLVMDEPTASLDFGNQVRVLDRVVDLRARGMAVLLSTHHPDHARHVADRVLLLKRGRIVAAGTPAALVTASQLAALYDLDPGRLADAGPGWLSSGGGR